jgi:hypothetical protein
MERNWERIEYRRGRSVVSLLKARRYRGPERPGLRGGMQGSTSVIELLSFSRPAGAFHVPL